MIWSALVLALRAIRRNVMRSLLTTLGIVIGVGAVIAMVTIGEGATARVTNDLAGLGQNLLIAIPGADRRQSTNSIAPPFTIGDVEAIKRDVLIVENVAPTGGIGARVVYGNKNWNTGIVGSDNNYLAARSWQIAEGREFLDGELRGGNPVCIIAETVRQKLFGDGDALGTSVRIGGVSCQIVGLLVSKGPDTFGNDRDDFVLMPLTAFQRRIAGNDTIGAINASAIHPELVETARQNIEAVLRHRRHIRAGQDDNFVVRDLKEVSSLLRTVTGVLTMLLSAIAGISLLVGGVGIMNIMLVSVTERTREIGIRMAVGARSQDVLLQFLVEAIALSMIGGIVGIVFGLGGSYAATRALKLPFVFLPEIVVAAFAFAALIGIFFGFYPARRAAKLNPIDALRYE